MTIPIFDLTHQTAVVTGGAGSLCSAMCRTLAECGANVAILGLHLEKTRALAEEICQSGGIAVGLACDVMDQESIIAAANTILEKFGRVDILINGAGGNRPEATTNPQQDFFNLPAETLRRVLDLNLIGTILPCQVFGKQMAEQESGVIINISSMSSFRPLTRIPAYSAAKAGVSNFTQWLAVYMAQEYSPKIRVNALAPGFFLGEQNKKLLLNEDGTLTARGQQIISHTPMGRFGVPEDLLGTLIWLASPASAFVSGIVVPVDGGFSAYSGV